MSQAVQSPGESWVDLALAVEGGPLPEDHSLELWKALVVAQQGLSELRGVAVLPIRGTSQCRAQVLLGRHSRLWMRVPESAVEAILGLCGVCLEVAGAPLKIGNAKTRALAPYATLYARRVIADTEDEGRFALWVSERLAALDVRREFIVGSRSSVREAGGRLTGFSLMLPELGARESLRLQAEGLGAGRHLGCGVFLGHK